MQCLKLVGNRRRLVTLHAITTGKVDTRARVSHICMANTPKPGSHQLLSSLHLSGANPVRPCLVSGGSSCTNTSHLARPLQSFLPSNHHHFNTAFQPSPSRHSISTPYQPNINNLTQHNTSFINMGSANLTPRQLEILVAVVAEMPAAEVGLQHTSSRADDHD